MIYTKDQIALACLKAGVPPAQIREVLKALPPPVEGPTHLWTSQTGWLPEVVK